MFQRDVEVRPCRPTFGLEVYARRRKQLMDQIGPRAAVILPAAPVAVRSNDVEYTYRPENDLLYLTGLAEPEAVCLLLPGHGDHEFTLFVRPYDRERHIWVGEHCGVEGALHHFGAQRAYPIAQLDQVVGSLVSERDELYYRFGRDEGWNQRVIGWMRQWQRLRPRTGRGPWVIRDLGELLHEMRLRKAAEEIACIREAAAIACEGHLRAMQTVRPGMFEYEVEALLDGTFRRLGATGPAYPSIVASGANATVLHYTANSRRLEEGDLLLIDAGAEFAYYCSDVTRTFPVGKRFSPVQRDLYTIVLRAQLAAIDCIGPGVAYDEPHRRAVRALTEGLVGLGILRGSVEENLENETYKKFYMHRTSHWLGMDVHDVGRYRTEDGVRTFEPGFVLTVEPGLYFSPDAADVPEDVRGIGIRIEDDVLVSPDGHEVLTASVPKMLEEIEALREAACLTA